MKVNFKQGKYILPLVFYPILCLFFYVYQDTSAKEAPVVEEKKGIQENVSGVSDEVQKKGLSDKLSAYTEEYKEADGYSAIGSLDPDAKEAATYSSGYSDREKTTLDSIERATQERFGVGSTGGRSTNYQPQSPRRNSLSAEDRALATALSNLGQTVNEPKAQIRQPSAYRSLSQSQEKSEPKENDPMETFKKQMEYMDSVQKSSDPEFRAEADRQKALVRAEAERAKYRSLTVTKAADQNGFFNSVYASKEGGFIKAIIDENIVGYAGSRIRLRLLEDIKAGNHTIKRGQYVYALISGFTEQRVKLTITTVLQNDKILPIQLDVYDVDGLEGLYVPSSAFREFSRSLGGESMQGFNLQSMQGGQSAQNQQQFLMSTIDKVFTSTSEAIANLIRKNKAKIKYNTYIYLIDKKELQNDQQNY